MALDAVLVLLAFVGAATFPILYLTRSGKPTTWAGWSSLWFSIVVATTLGLSLLRAIFGDYPGREWVRYVVFAAIIGVLWWQDVILFLLQRRRRRGTPADR